MKCYNCRKNDHFAKTCQWKEKNQGWAHTEVIEVVNVDKTEYKYDEMGYDYHQNLAGVNQKPSCWLIVKAAWTCLMMQNIGWIFIEQRSHGNPNTMLDV